MKNSILALLMLAGCGAPSTATSDSGVADMQLPSKDLAMADSAVPVKDLSARALDLAGVDIRTVDLAAPDLQVPDLRMTPDLSIRDLVTFPDLIPACTPQGHCGLGGPCCPRCCIGPILICDNSNVCSQAHGCNQAEGDVNNHGVSLAAARVLINTPHGDAIFDALVACCGGAAPLGPMCGLHQCNAQNQACLNDLP